MTPGGSRAAVAAAAYGVPSAGLYGLLFWDEALIVELCSTPGLTGALFPVAVALVFSFVHGAFTGKFWDAFGVKPRRGGGR